MLVLKGLGYGMRQVMGRESSPGTFGLLLPFHASASNLPWVSCPEKQKLEQLDNAQDEVCGCAWVHSHDYANNNCL